MITKPYYLNILIFQRKTGPTSQHTVITIKLWNLEMTIDTSYDVPNFKPSPFHFKANYLDVVFRLNSFNTIKAGGLNLA